MNRSHIFSILVGIINKIWRTLKGEIDDIKKLNRFLDYWDCTTGKSLTDPPIPDYPYETGDFYRVVKVGTTNYRPYGTSWSSQASTVVETEEVKRDYIYYYNGTEWTLIDVAGVQFKEIAGQPTDNTALNTALGGKVDKDTSTSVYPKAYVKGTDGTQSTAIYTSDAYPSSLVYRKNDGGIVLPTTAPANDTYAASRGYVDNATNMIQRVNRFNSPSGTGWIRIGKYARTNSYVGGSNETLDLIIKKSWQDAKDEYKHIRFICNSDNKKFVQIEGVGSNNSISFNKIRLVRNIEANNIFIDINNNSAGTDKTLVVFSQIPNNSETINWEPLTPTQVEPSTLPANEEVVCSLDLKQNVDIDDKLDKKTNTTTLYQAYTKSPSGATEMINVTQGTSVYSIAERTSQGALKVATQVDDNDVTRKDYVDAIKNNYSQLRFTDVDTGDVVTIKALVNTEA